MIHIGIDPGHSGAIAILDDTRLIVHDMPVLTKTIKRNRRIKNKETGVFTYRKRIGTDVFFDSRKFTDLLRPYADKKTHLTLEKQQLWGQNEKAGTNSSDVLLKEYGALRSILEVLNIPFVEILPKSWQNFLDKPETKSGSVKLAKFFYPDAPVYGPLGGLMDGRADAILIAHYDKCKYPSSANMELEQIGQTTQTRRNRAADRPVSNDGE